MSRLRAASFSDTMLSGQHAQLYHAHSPITPASTEKSVSAHYQQQDLEDDALFTRPRSHTPSLLQQQQARVQAAVHAQVQRKNMLRKQSINRVAGDDPAGFSATAAVGASPLLKPDTILLHSHSALVLNAPSLTAGLYASSAGVPSSRAMAAFNLSSSLSGLSLLQQQTATPAAGAAVASPPVVVDAQGFMVQISPGQRDAAISAAGAAALAASAAAAEAAATAAPSSPLSHRSRRRQLHVTPAAGYGSHAQAFYESMVSVTGGPPPLPVPVLAGSRHAFLIHQPLTSITAVTVLDASPSRGDTQGRNSVVPSGITFNGVNMSSVPSPSQQTQRRAEDLSRSSNSSILAFDPSSIASSTAPPASAAPLSVPTARPGTLKAVPLETIRAGAPTGSRALLALAHAPVTSYKLDLSSPSAAAAAAVVAAAATGAAGPSAANALPRLATTGESEQLAALRRQHASPLSASITGPGSDSSSGSNTAMLRPRKDPALIVTATGQTMDALAIARARKLLALTLAQTKMAKAGGDEEQKSNSMATGSQSERRSAAAARTALLFDAVPRSARRAAPPGQSNVPRVVLASTLDTSTTGAKIARVASPAATSTGAVNSFAVPRSTPPLHNKQQTQQQQQPRKRAVPPPLLLPSLSVPAVTSATTKDAAASVSFAPMDSPVATPVAAVAVAPSLDGDLAPVSAVVVSPASPPAVNTVAAPISNSSPAAAATTPPASMQQQSQPQRPAQPTALRPSPSAAALTVSSPSVISLSVSPAPVLAIPASAVADADSLLSALSVRRPPPEQKRYLNALHHSFAEMASANQSHVQSQSKSVTAQALDHTALERAELDRSARAQARVLQAGLDGMERATAESKVQADAAWIQSVSEIDRVYSARSTALQTRLAQIAAQRQIRSQRLVDELAAQREEAEVEELAQIAREERLEELKSLETKLSAHASRTAQRWAQEWSAASAQREAAAAQDARDQLVKQAEIRAFMSAQYEAKRAQAKAGVLWVRVIRGQQLGEEPMQHGAVSRSASSSDLLAPAASPSSSGSRLPKLSTCCLSFSLRFKAASLANDSCHSSFFGREGDPRIDEVFKMRVSNAALQTLTIAIQAAQPRQVEVWERELRAALACGAQLSTAQQVAGETTQLTQLDQLAQAGLLRVHSALTAVPSSMALTAPGSASAATPSPAPVPLLPTPSSHCRHVSFQSHARSASSSGGGGAGSLHDFAAEMQQRSSVGTKTLGTIGEATPEASRAASKISIHTPTTPAESSRNSPSPQTPLQAKQQHSDPSSPVTPSLSVLAFPVPASASGSRRGLRTHSRQLSSGGSHDLFAGTPSGSPSGSPSPAAAALSGPVSVSSMSSSAISQLQSVAHLRPRSEVLSRVEEVGSVEIALASIRSAPHGRVAGEFQLTTPLTEQKRKEREAKRAEQKRKQAVSRMQPQGQEDVEVSPVAPSRRLVRHATSSSSSGSVQTIRCGSVTVELWLLPLFDNSADAAAAAASSAGGLSSSASAPRTIRSRLRIGVSELSAEEQRKIDAQLESDAEARAAATEMPVWNPASNGIASAPSV